MLDDAHEYEAEAVLVAKVAMVKDHKFMEPNILAT